MLLLPSSILLMLSIGSMIFCTISDTGFKKYFGLVKHGISLCAMVNSIFLSVFASIFAWSVSILFFIDKENVEGNGYSYEYDNLLVFLLAILLLFLSLLFLAINLLFYNDHNPYSKSIFNINSRKRGVLKFFLKIFYIAVFMLSGSADIRPTVLIVTILSHGYLIFTSSRRVDNSKFLVQISLTAMDGFVLTVCLTAVMENALEQSTNIMYSLVVNALCVFAIVLYVFRSKQEAENVFSFQEITETLSDDNIYERLLIILSIVRSQRLFDKYKLYLYLKKEIKRLDEQLGVAVKGYDAFSQACLTSPPKASEFTIKTQLENGALNEDTQL